MLKTGQRSGNNEEEIPKPARNDPLDELQARVIALHRNVLRYHEPAGRLRKRAP